MAWIMNDELGRPVNTEAPDIPQRPFVNDSPNKMWKIRPGRNNGMPITGLMPERPRYNPQGNLTCYIGDTPVTALYIGDIAATALL